MLDGNILGILSLFLLEKDAEWMKPETGSGLSAFAVMVLFFPGHSMSFHQDNRHINTYSVEITRTLKTPRSVDLHPKMHLFSSESHFSREV